MSAAVAAADWRRLDFSVETFGAELFALCRQVPLLDHLLCRLDEVHDPISASDMVLRSYQRDLAAQGWFGIALPLARVTLRSGPGVMLEDKTVFYGVQGRRDLIVAAARVGFTHPLCSVVLPLHRTVINLRGPGWNVDIAAAQRAMALFAAAGIDWAAGTEATPCVVTGDMNYAHHLWNQLGALATLLEQCPRLHVRATHQPIAPLKEIFAEYPGLTVTPTPIAELPRLDPRRVVPGPAGGKIILRPVRERILRLAEQHANEDVRAFVGNARAAGLTLIWLTVRAQGRTALNLFDALAAVGEALLRRANIGIVIDGYSRPNDYATNRDYDRANAERAIAQELTLTRMLLDDLARRVGDTARPRCFVSVGADLLDSIHLAAQCRAYFAHHGTVQHKTGYFTTVPGMAHANPGILSTDPAASHRHVAPDGGLVEYVDRSLVQDVVAVGGSRLHPSNAYRFTDIPRLVTVFDDFLARQGVK